MTAASSALNGAAATVVSSHNTTLKTILVSAVAGAVIGLANLFTCPPKAK